MSVNSSIIDVNLHRPKLACFSLFLYLELFWRNNKTIIEFGFRRIICRSKRVLSTEAFHLQNPSCPTQPHSIIANFIFYDFNYYSKGGLQHIPFFFPCVFWFVLIDLYMSIQSRRSSFLVRLIKIIKTLTLFSFWILFSI